MYTREELLQELERRQGKSHSLESTSNAEPATEPLAYTREELEQELAKRRSGFMHRAGQLGRGFLSSIGGSHDILRGVGNNLVTGDIPAAPILTPEEQAGLPEAEQRVLKANELYPAHKMLPESAGLGEQYEPTKKDILGHFLKGAGEFSAPSPFLPLGGYGAVAKAAGKGLGAVGKALGKEAAIAGGASAGIHATPKLTEEGTGLSSMEDFAKALLGAKAASALPSSLKSAFNPYRLATIGAKPNERVFELAKQHDIELPVNVGMRAAPLNFAANVLTKSMFSSRLYKDALIRANDSVVNAVKKSIDTLGLSESKPHEVSGEYRRFLQEEEKSVEEAANKMYDDAALHLKEGESTKPLKTIKFIKGLRELVTRDIKSAPTRKVANILAEISDSWGIAPPNIIPKDLENSPKLIEAYLKSFEENVPNVPIEKLIGIRKELGTITKHDPTIKGAESFLNGLKSAVDKDVESISKSNPEFISRWREANKFYKRQVGDRFRNSISRSILAHEAPTDAYNMMNTVQNVQEMRKISGESPQATEIFNALAKTKVKDMFANALKDESLGLAPFINVFKRRSATAELLEELMGKPEFKKLSEISEISQEFQRSGRELLNTSGSAIAHSDLSKIETVAKGIISAIIPGVAIVSPQAVVAAGGAMAMTNLISRAMANPKFINNARAYAMARQAGREQQATSILNRLIKITELEARVALSEAQKEKQEKPKKSH